MTFEEIDKEFGFHDAKLYELRIDYVNGTGLLRMALDFGDPDGPKHEDYRVGVLRISGLCFCAISPPDPDCRYMPHGFPLNVAGYSVDTDTFPALDELSRTLPPGVTCFQFFVHEWNRFFNIAAKDVQIFWEDEETPKVE